jgi:hypothetical protein
LAGSTDEAERESAVFVALDAWLLLQATNVSVISVNNAIVGFID